MLVSIILRYFSYTTFSYFVKDDVEVEFEFIGVSFSRLKSAK